MFEIAAQLHSSAEILTPADPLFKPKIKLHDPLIYDVNVSYPREVLPDFMILFQFFINQKVAVNYLLLIKLNLSSAANEDIIPV